MLKAGVAIRELTPNCRTRTAGYPDPPGRSALMAHDPLYCSAYYLENDDTRMLFMTNDLISLTKDRANELRMLIEKHTGISRKNIAIACTHTHSGPATGNADWENYGEPRELEPENNDRMRDLMLAAAKEAIANPFDAKIGWGVGVCGKEHGIGGNRHDPENGPADPLVSVIAIKNLDDELRGCMVNYSMHPTVLHAENFFYTADFPCYIRETLNAKYPFMIFGFQMGSSGDQSTRFFRTAQTFDEARRIGSTIGNVALEVLDQMEFVTDAVLKSASAFVTLPLKDFPSHEEAVEKLAYSQKIYDDLVAANAPYSKTRAAQSILEGSIYMAGFTKSLEGTTLEKIMEHYIPLECHAMRIGDCCIVGVNCENFVAVSQAVKAASPFAVTMLSSLTNGNTLGYVCTDEAYDRFCYEAQASPFAKGAADAVIQGMLQAVEAVK